MNPTPVVLYGEHVRLEPLDHRHADDLMEVSAVDEIWRYMPVTRPLDRETVLSLIDKAWKAAAEGVEIPFAIIDDRTDRAVGSTRFLEIRRPDRALEIGWTWLGVASQRTPINTESKYLLLRHVFEELGALRVQLKTDGRNERSQRAIERIGAVREGVLRHHRLMWDGVYRDTVYYSVLAPEWPEVKARLEGLLGR
ncbi:MAG: GNAT family protein [Gemmatimonadales bacterium]|nr:GNAT family protein [Gemmatimonadales bacterium]